jgi:hypothetical protein
MREITTSLSARAVDGLERMAKEKGVTPEEALALMVEQELVVKTRPKPCRGKVQPFRRKG